MHTCLVVLFKFLWECFNVKYKKHNSSPLKMLYIQHVSNRCRIMWSTNETSIDGNVCEWNKSCNFGLVLVFVSGVNIRHFLVPNSLSDKH